MIPNKWHSKSAKASAFAFKLRKKQELLLRLCVALVVLRHLHDEQVHRALLVVIQLAEVEDEAEFCIRQVRGDEFACRRVMTDKIVDGHAEVVCDAGQNGNVRLGIAVLILVDGLLADLNEISQSALAQTPERYGAPSNSRA